jgi:phage-related protein
MTSARNYDVILTVADASNFVPGNTVIGVTTKTTGFIANVNSTDKQVKVKLNNVLQEFQTSETIHSNIITISGTANGALNTLSVPFQSNVRSGEVTSASSTISSIAPSPFIAEKNAFSQNPVVRLYELYYPGEWYPTNEAGNPTGDGEGRSWPNDFPVRFADIRAELAADLSYNVSYDGTSYIPFPVNISSLEQSSDGKVNDLTLTVFNVDNIITALVEDPYLVGNCTTNSVVAFVNGEAVHGIDPRTVNANPADVGSAGDEAFDTLTRARANGLAFSTSVVGIYGRANASFTKTQCESINGTWQEGKPDTRDLLGGVVNIKTTFANFLDHWPEYSKVRYVGDKFVEVLNALPYRIGDNVKTEGTTVEATIEKIEENKFLFLSNNLAANTQNNSQLFIVNNNSDTESYIEDTFKIDQLENLREAVADFGLVSWLQFFKQVTPKRKYYKNVCQWEYKGEECQYPGPGGGTIPGTSLSANASPITAANEAGSTDADDVCGKNIQACTLRNNQIHFGGFPATGRTIPKQ